jgi:hypothetical protein
LQNELEVQIVNSSFFIVRPGMGDNLAVKVRYYVADMKRIFYHAQKLNGKCFDLQSSNFLCKQERSERMPKFNG